MVITGPGQYTLNKGGISLPKKLQDFLQESQKEYSSQMLLLTISRADLLRLCHEKKDIMLSLYLFLNLLKGTKSEW